VIADLLQSWSGIDSAPNSLFGLVDIVCEESHSVQQHQKIDLPKIIHVDAKLLLT
jgi:hypothetical protein